LAKAPVDEKENGKTIAFASGILRRPTFTMAGREMNPWNLV
jgi:hypothetical protein